METLFPLQGATAQADPAGAMETTALPTHFTRRDFLSIAGVTLVGGSLALMAGQTQAAQPAPATNGTLPQPGKQPNLVLIINDQERYVRHWPADWVANNLPTHNRLFANGLVFRRAFCNAAMCSPSRATLFTGLHPAQHGVVHTLTQGGTKSNQEATLSTEIQTMGRMLASAGYNVVYKGKWHMSKHADGGEPTAADVLAYGFQGWEPTALANDAAVENFAGGCADLDRQVTEQAVTFLSAQTGQQPFALVVGLGNPHDVLAYPNTWDQVEEDGCDNYTGLDFNQGIDLPPTVNEDLATKPTCQAQSLTLYAFGLGPVATPQKKREYVNFYAALIKEVDTRIGQVLDAIPEALRDDTIVIFTSDHGEMGMSHNGLRQKMYNAYEETVNIPLVIHNRKQFPTPQTTDAYASLIDLMPTLATLASVPNRERWIFYGRDLTPVINDPAQSVQNEILFTFDDEDAATPDGLPTNPATGKPMVTQPNHIRALLAKDSDGAWKYARYFDPAGVEAEQYEMYHLYDGQGQPVDPNEIDNIANAVSPKFNNPTYSAKRTDLAQRLAKLERARLQPLSEVYLPLVAAS